MSSWNETILKVKKCFCHTSTVAQCDKGFKTQCQPELACPEPVEEERLTGKCLKFQKRLMSHFD